MKRGISILLAFTIIFSLGGTVVVKADDISTHWAKNEISYLVEKEVLNGYPDGTFKPNNPMTKVEFYKIINGLLGFEGKALVTFGDVKPIDWFYNIVAKAIAAGYISSTDLLLPNENITRQEVVRILGVVYNINNDSQVANKFNDSALISEDIIGYIGTLLEKGLLNGYSDGSFKPTSNITRAEVVKMIYDVQGNLNVLLIDEVDKSELEKAIDIAKDLDDDDYTNATWTDLEDSLDKAIKVFNDDKSTKQDIDKALEELEGSVDDLKKVRKSSSSTNIKYEITFRDWDGTVLNTEIVNKGSNVIAPANPTREGYIFVGWSTGLANISENLNITAVYEIIQPDLYDKLVEDVNYLTQQLSIIQLTITKLQQEVANLKAELELEDTPVVSIEDLEDALNDDYDEIGNVTIEDIILDGDEDYIEVGIYVDLTDDDEYASWGLLDDNYKEDFLQDIVDDILAEYEDAVITGFIEDEYNDEELVSFSVSSSGIVSIDGSSSSSDLADLEDYLNQYYDVIEEFDVLNIEVFGDEDDIEVVINVDENDLNDLTDSEIENYLEDMYDDILYDFPDAEVFGSFEDNGVILEFDFDSSGIVDLVW